MWLRIRMTAVQNSKLNHTCWVTKLALRPWQYRDCSEVTSVNTPIYTSFSSDITTQSSHILSDGLITPYIGLRHPPIVHAWRKAIIITGLPHTFYNSLRIERHNFENAMCLVLRGSEYTSIFRSHFSFSSGVTFLILVIFFLIFEISHELHHSMLQKNCICKGTVVK